MKKIRNTITILFLIAAILFCFAGNIHGADEDAQAKVQPQPATPENPPVLTLQKAVMCEAMKDLEPRNEAIIFSVAIGKATCFTAFDPVPEKTVVQHNWFKRDQPDAMVKLTLKPPKWSSFSEMTIHNGDVGPWRVEITDVDGKIFKTLRFSVTE